MTLLEMLIVLLIIGIMAGVTVLGLGSLDRGNRAEAEAMRLADRLQLASDDVLVSSAPLAMIWDTRGYRFLRWDPARSVWQASDQPLLGQTHILPAALQLERPGANGTPAVMITPNLPQPEVQFRITGSSAPWAVIFDGFGAAATALGQ